MKWSINKAAAEFGVARDTIRRGLAQVGIEVPKTTDQVFTTAEIVAALYGDLKLQRTRKAESEADILEMKRKVMVGDLMPTEGVVAMIRDVLQPIREAWLALPDSMAVRCNPQDPEHARAELELWKDRSMGLVRDTLRPKSSGNKAPERQKEPSKVKIAGKKKKRVRKANKKVVS